jgi:hypothetical protein
MAALNVIYELAQRHSGVTADYERLARIQQRIDGVAGGADRPAGVDASEKSV